MSICIIFNPTAKGEKARRFRQRLASFGEECVLKLTAAVGDARRLAAEAVQEGFETVVAAGGDGTLNEVLNGIGDAPAGLKRARLGVLPLGTVNVFARELRIPIQMDLAWETIRAGHERLIDLPEVSFESKGLRQRRYFAQFAGAGLDARAVELADWELKKKIGQLAYVVAAFKAMGERRLRRESPHESPLITVSAPGCSASGEWIIIGNGVLYGGDYKFFPDALLNDSLLEVCVFPKVDWLTIARFGPELLLRGKLPAAVQRFQAPSVTLSASWPSPLHLDGELVGHVPAEFSIHSSRLRVLAP